MTPTTQDLARQLAAHPRWTWMAGMRVFHLDGLDHGWPHRVGQTGDAYPRKWVPCLDDSPTCGRLIEMLGDQLVSIHHRRKEGEGGEKWRAIVVAPDGRNQTAIGATLGEALGRALLDAWGEA